ncbi:MAG: hypothetical protein ABIO70_12950 [Pseudomonadota bacterium]
MFDLRGQHDLVLTELSAGVGTGLVELSEAGTYVFFDPRGSELVVEAEVSRAGTIALPAGTYLVRRRLPDRVYQGELRRGSPRVGRVVGRRVSVARHAHRLIQWGQPLGTPSMPFLLLFHLALRPVLAAPCPASSAELAAHVAAARRAYVGFDLDGFAAEVTGVEARLPCLVEVVSPGQALDLHLQLGLSAWLLQDPQALAAAARAVVALDPSFEPPPEIAPQGSRLRAVFATAREGGGGGSVEVDGPALWVDGTLGDPRLPEARAALVQWQAPDAGLQSWYLDGLGLPPELLERLALAAPPVPRARHRSRWLLVAGGVAATGGVAALLGARQLEGAYWQSYDPAAERRLYMANRALGIGGYVLLAGAGAATAGALVLGEL